MKAKTDFTTNSSSTSFLVTDARNGYVFPDYGEELVSNSDLGETEFGWGIANIYDIGSRINFAYLQTICGKNKEWLKMLEDVIKENTNVKTIGWNIKEDYGTNWGYIDHQSSASEGANTEIFFSKEALKDFLFGKGSYIHLDNDNE